jgi:N utilization substance protein B
MAQMNRKQQREAAFQLLFSADFNRDQTPEQIYEVWCDENESSEAEYAKQVFFGVCQNQEEIDALIERHTNGWKISRLARISRAIIRLCTYEMVFAGVPAPVAINEAIELAKTYDDQKARSFVNGVLGSIKKELEENAQ